MPNLTHLGYPTHADWLAAVDRSQPVNALCVVEAGRSGPSGISITKQVVVLSQAQGSAVHYLRLVVDSYQSLDGRTALDPGRDIDHRAESAWKIIQSWLAEEKLTVRRAILAFPKTLRLLDGSAAGLMEYSRELGYWIFAGRIPAECRVITLTAEVPPLALPTA